MAPEKLPDAPKFAARDQQWEGPADGVEVEGMAMPKNALGPGTLSLIHI